MDLVIKESGCRFLAVSLLIVGYQLAAPKSPYLSVRLQCAEIFARKVLEQVILA